MMINLVKKIKMTIHIHILVVSLFIIDFVHVKVVFATVSCFTLQWIDRNGLTFIGILCLDGYLSI
mgnify:CR=1 FL=1